MGLDVASTSLSIPTWAEFGTVSYTAGTLGTTADCVTEVESKLKRGRLSSTTTPSTTEVERWLYEAKQQLIEYASFTWGRRYVTATLTAGTYRYALPPDFAGMVSIRDKTNDSKVGVVSPHQFDVLYPDVDEEGNGSILVACVKGMELWVAPPPDGDDVLEMEYKRSGADVSITEEGRLLLQDGSVLLLQDASAKLLSESDSAYTTEFSWFPEIERFRCCDYAIAKSFAALRDWEGANFYYAKWKEGLTKALRSDGKKQRSSSGYRARSVFQA